MFIESPAYVPVRPNTVRRAPSEGTAAPNGRADGSGQICIAQTPSPIVRILNDLDAHLRNRHISRVTTAHLCNRLLLELELHFDADESCGPLHDLALADPTVQADVNRCVHEHAEVLDRAKELVRDAGNGLRGLAWQRQLNRDFAKLRDRFSAQHRDEFQFIRHVHGLDVRDSD